ncbi:MAG: helix-turn-helix domain-containing protein [Eubacteriales bacterium]
MDTQIKRIRQKIPDEGLNWGIRTVYGVGYKFGASETKTNNDGNYRYMSETDAKEQNEPNDAAAQKNRMLRQRTKQDLFLRSFSST